MEVDYVLINKMKVEIEKIIFERQENETLHNSRQWSQKLYTSIKNGDMEGIKNIIDTPMNWEMGRLADDELRSVKNSALCLISEVTTAAYEGGIPIDTAFSISDAYSRSVEKMTKQSNVYAAMMAICFDFSERVENIQKKTKTNFLVEKVKDYIFKNMYSTFSIMEMGKDLGVNSSYLSQIFKKIEGITIQQYVLKERIKISEKLLMFSKYSLEEISSYLAFSSQSHFGKIFKSINGITPKEYREKNSDFVREKIK
jgi:YesN/AraC family two-component response regulator